MSKTKKKTTKKKSTPKPKVVTHLVVYDLTDESDPVKECYSLKEAADFVKKTIEKGYDDNYDDVVIASFKVYEVTGKIGRINTGLIFE